MNVELKSVDLHKIEPVFSKMKKDFSILRMSMLTRLMAMAKFIEYSYSEIHDGNTYESLALKSILMPKGIVYELIRLDLQGRSEIYIYVCTIDKNKKTHRNFCAYANGDVLVWGPWLVELLETLPTTYEKIRKEYYNKLISLRQKQNLLPQLDEEWSEEEIAKFNNDFNNSGLLSNEVIDCLYSCQQLVIS